ncbi:flavodoxin domain-containing protein [Aeromicrobium duanguangcaii]|uniref:Flavodoxin domain-containing protein n=1 Tax=Aeromicrobium duanguangcaii TaxID=2968086 RepID=A0ABY5KDY3_9ACTN|nr:flavodoxin domain-containing protein [Aeromicrobium duanguangcaii]MCD9154265.1 flavodoxin domain-containing protein [Aeromicrobium duanguangcaii]UUI68667.1 flavodoxin domain-containing protein [Aeromicrobium duanguangcaii]
MDILVVHASKYGSARRYAEWIAEALDAPVAASDEVSPAQLAEHDLVVFCAAIYGPMLRDSGVLKDAMQIGGSTRWVLVTVGLSDPDLSTKRDELVAAKFEASLRDRLEVFHLRGAMDRDRLNMVERSMMSGVRKALTGKRARTPDDQAMLEVLSDPAVDLTDRAAIAPIVESCLR